MIDFLQDKSRNWILDGKKPIPATILEWGEMMANFDQKRVDQTIIKKINISTVFLGYDSGFCFNDGPPVLFETMIFGGKHDGYMDRYCTWDEAEEGHAIAVRFVIESQRPINLIRYWLLEAWITWIKEKYRPFRYKVLYKWIPLLKKYYNDFTRK